jgi:hypothetical protein
VAFVPVWYLLIGSMIPHGGQALASMIGLSLAWTVAFVLLGLTGLWLRMPRPARGSRLPAADPLPAAPADGQPAGMAG